MFQYNYLWTFQGDGADSANGIFSTKDLAEKYIKEYSLSGMLIKLPLNVSVYQWAIDMGYFNPTKDYMKSSQFIQQFNSGYLEHYHYQDGKEV